MAGFRGCARPLALSSSCSVIVRSLDGPLDSSLVMALPNKPTALPAGEHPTHRIARRATCGGGPDLRNLLAPALRRQLLGPLSIAAHAPGHVLKVFEYEHQAMGR